MSKAESKEQMIKDIAYQWIHRNFTVEKNHIDINIETSSALCNRESFFAVTGSFTAIAEDNQFKKLFFYADANPPRLINIYVVDHPKTMSTQMELRFRARRENLTLLAVLTKELKEKGVELTKPYEDEYIEEVVQESASQTEEDCDSQSESTSSQKAIDTINLSRRIMNPTPTGSRTLNIVSNAVDSVRGIANSIRKTQELKSERLQNEVLQQRLDILKNLSSEKEALEEMKLKLEIERTKLEIQKMRLENERLKKELGQS